MSDIFLGLSAGCVLAAIAAAPSGWLRALLVVAFLFNVLALASDR